MSSNRRDRLIFGIGRIHHLTLRSTRRRLLLRALEAGFRTFDVAPAYGNGIAETELGDVLRASEISVAVNTKVGIPVRIYPALAANVFPVARGIDLVTGGHRLAYSKRDFSPRAIRDSLDGSLRRLRRDRVETLFLHEPIEPITPEEHWEIGDTMRGLILQGKIAAWGIAGPRRRYAGQNAHISREFSVQQPLSEWLLEPTESRIFNATLYGTYQAFLAAGRSDSFASYIDDFSSRFPELRFLVATNQIERVSKLID